MNSYVIPYIEESYHKIRVVANSLEEALQQFDEKGPVIGVQTLSVTIPDSVTVDNMGILYENQVKYPVECERYEDRYLNPNV